MLGIEEAIAGWRNHAEHMVMQKEGKATVFDLYRLRVAQVVRDYDFSSSAQES